MVENQVRIDKVVYHEVALSSHLHIFILNSFSFPYLTYVLSFLTNTLTHLRIMPEYMSM